MYNKIRVRVEKDDIKGTKEETTIFFLFIYIVSYGALECFIFRDPIVNSFRNHSFICAHSHNDYWKILLQNDWSVYCGYIECVFLSSQRNSFVDLLEISVMRL